MTAFELIIEYCVKRQNSALSFTNSRLAACVFSDNDFHPATMFRRLVSKGWCFESGAVSVELG